jgi:hypothetical protein
MEEQSIRAAVEKLRAQKLRRVDLHKMMDSIDQGLEDTEIARQFGILPEDVGLVRRVLRD